MELLQNHVLMVSLVAWAAAQMLKALIFLLVKGEFKRSHFVTSGGMPSAHSALVSALAAAVGLREGLSSTNFALAAAFAAIVLYDAAGVRQAVSIQARLLNNLIDEYLRNQEWNETRLRELLGHTKVEVVAGCALGLLIAFLWQ